MVENEVISSSLNQLLEGKTKLQVRVSLTFDVTAPELKGQLTGLSQACDLVQHQVLRAVKWNPSSPGCDGLVIHLERNADFFHKLGVKLITEGPNQPSVELDAPTLPWWEAPEGPIFKSLLFHGSGEYSMWEAAVLKKRFETALDLQGALQQPGHPTSEEEWEEEKEMLRKGHQFLEDTVRDIATALLGREIIFGEELPYP